jgi:hypothetical protein
MQPPVAEWKPQRREVSAPLTYRPGDLAEVDLFEVWVDVAASAVAYLRGARAEEARPQSPSKR